MKSLSIVLAAVLVRSSAASTHTCPPDPASSIEEVDYYCPGAVSFFSDADDDSDTHRFATSYECYDEDDHVSCKGSIDATIQPPLCSKNISSCIEEDFESVCQGHPSIFSFCSGYFGDDLPMFRCWDRVASHWCQGSITPTNGTFQSPVCPTEPLSRCDELEHYGIRHTACSCSVAEGHGMFSCLAEDGETAWCEGTIRVQEDIEPPARDNDEPNEKNAYTAPNHDSQDARGILILLLLGSLFLLVIALFAIYSWRQRRYQRQAQRLREEETLQGDKDEPDGIRYSDDVEMTGDNSSPRATSPNFERQGKWYW